MSSYYDFLLTTAYGEYRPSTLLVEYAIMGESCYWIEDDDDLPNVAPGVIVSQVAAKKLIGEDQEGNNFHLYDGPRDQSCFLVFWNKSWRSYLVYVNTDKDLVYGLIGTVIGKPVEKLVKPNQLIDTHKMLGVTTTFKVSSKLPAHQTRVIEVMCREHIRTTKEDKGSMKLATKMRAENIGIEVADRIVNIVKPGTAGSSSIGSHRTEKQAVRK